MSQTYSPRSLSTSSIKQQVSKWKRKSNLRCCWLVLSRQNYRINPSPLKKHTYSFSDWNLNGYVTPSSLTYLTTFTCFQELLPERERKRHDWFTGYYSNFSTNLPSSIFLLFFLLLLWSWWARTAGLPDKAWRKMISSRVSVKTTLRHFNFKTTKSKQSDKKLFKKPHKEQKKNPKNPHKYKQRILKIEKRSWHVLLGLEYL